MVKSSADTSARQSTKYIRELIKIESILSLSNTGFTSVLQYHILQYIQGAKLPKYGVCPAESTCALHIGFMNLFKAFYIRVAFQQ